ncbi:MAG: UDP-N-acetylmuramoyl-L-alanyl-D-glutamate--2,6-diaminopimelate ligase [Actinomycetota bacterium]
MIAPGPLARPLALIVTDLPGHEIGGGDPSIPISEVAYRSGDAVPGSLFFCVRGARSDGHEFAADAVLRGAVALVVERWLPVDAVQVLVPSVRQAMGPVSAEVFGRPADRMAMVGVTGTNGKTTTTYLLESIFRSAGSTPGVVGTTGVRIDGEPVPLPKTTPEAPDLHRLLARMAERGVGAVAMEVSSHGLDQHRVDGIVYDCAVFTNLSQDHLDYHPSMEEYFRAKARLFTPSMARRAVVNVDTAEGRRLLRSDLPTLTYGLEAGADLRATDISTSLSGLSFRVADVMIRSSLCGRFNVENCLAAFAAARAMGVPDDVIARGIASLREVPGRMETVEEGQEFLVIVDYAHTPDSVENVLRAARPLAAGRVILVLGCGGDRDRRKRPLMGKVATTLADLSVITSDNPRSEDPMAIIGEVEAGAREGERIYVVEEDRRLAIRLALAEARAGDVVVIAGKGHETGQEFADHTIPFDDRVVAAEELRRALEAS